MTGFLYTWGPCLEVMFNKVWVCPRTPWIVGRWLKLNDCAILIVQFKSQPLMGACPRLPEKGGLHTERNSDFIEQVRLPRQLTHSLLQNRVFLGWRWTNSVFFYFLFLENPLFLFFFRKGPCGLALGFRSHKALIRVHRHGEGFKMNRIL